LRFSPNKATSKIRREVIQINDYIEEVTNPDSGETLTKYYLAGVMRIPQSMNVEFLIGELNAAVQRKSRFSRWSPILSGI
jgi:hypothetical protein